MTRVRNSGFGWCMAARSPYSCVRDFPRISAGQAAKNPMNSKAAFNNKEVFY